MQVNAYHHLLLDMTGLHPVWLSELTGASHPGYELKLWGDNVPAGTLRTAAAMQGQNLAGYTQVVIEPWRPQRALQRETVVTQPHRGSGLELWLNAALMRVLQVEHPEVAEVETVVPANETEMLDVAKQLGFRLYRMHVIVEGEQEE